MSHRVEEKEARRAERLRREAEERRAQERARRARFAGYGGVGVIAAILITVAVAAGGGSSTPSDHVDAGAAVGAKAPDFELTDVVSGSHVSLRSLAGMKTLLFFSEGVGCQACMVQAADLQKDKALDRADIRIVSVTTDEPGDLATAAKQYGIRTMLLADPSTQMSAAYGMLGHGGMGHPTQDGHAFMLLDAGGKVLWHQAYQEMYVKPGKLHADMGLTA